MCSTCKNSYKHYNAFMYFIVAIKKERTMEWKVKTVLILVVVVLFYFDLQI